MDDKWSKWRVFPDHRARGILVAPIGPGVYELKNKKTGEKVYEKVYIGESKNVAKRMTSLVPNPEGSGTRKNSLLRKFVKQNLSEITYRTVACITKEEAKRLESLLRQKHDYLF